jgi:hypothetical protein
MNFIRSADMKATREYQYAKLARGLRALKEYTSNPRFLGVLKNFEVSWNSIGRYINEYERQLEAWEELKYRYFQSLASAEHSKETRRPIQPDASKKVHRKIRRMRV